MDIVKITPNKEKAKSLLKMVETTLAMIKDINADKFSSNVIKEYYEVLRELMTSLLLLDGYKTMGEGAHKSLIEYINKNYDFTGYEISLLDDLRILRNKIAYDGFFVKKDYLDRKKKDILKIISVFKEIIKKRL